VLVVDKLGYSEYRNPERIFDVPATKRGLNMDKKMEKFFCSILFPGMIITTALAFIAPFVLVEAPREAFLHSAFVFGILVALSVLGACMGTTYVSTIIARMEHPISLVVAVILYSGLMALSVLAVCDFFVNPNELYWVLGSFAVAYFIGSGNGYLIYTWEKPSAAKKA
jgi:hypothetical protein